MSQTRSDDTTEQKSKKMKMETASDSPGRLLLEHFQFKRILSISPERKSVAILAEHRVAGNEAVILLTKLAFDGKSIPRLFEPEKFVLKSLFVNDIYYNNFMLEAGVGAAVHTDSANESTLAALEQNDMSFSGAQANFVWPATQKHIEKHSQKQFFRFLETYPLYTAVTKPFLHANNMFSLKWVDNILDGTKEADRILLNDADPTNGFVLLPDLKWDTTNLSTLYCMAITRARIASIRELTSEHLPLLKRVREECTKAITEKYSISAKQLRLSFHYHPSFWHLHVHITHLSFVPPGQSVDRAHLLDQVIENIELCGEYYQRVALSINVAENDALYSLLTAHA